VTATLWIDKTYLTNLRAMLQEMLDDVSHQVNGLGNKSTILGNIWVPPVDGNLNITMPGGTPGTSSTFPLGADLNAKLTAMGGTVSDDVVWLQTVLGDMIDEIDTTIKSMSDTENLNEDTIQKLMDDFQQTLSDMSNGPSTPKPTGS
jgi:hypothetical protein